MVEPKKISIHTDYITLGQLLKLARVVEEGGEAKAYLASHEIRVNGENENRRGRKLRVNDEIEFPGFTIVLVAQ